MPNMPDEETTARMREELERKVQAYSFNRDWVQHHKAMLADNRAWWRGQGIPDAWQDFWGLGYVDKKVYVHDGVLYEGPAYTIPKFAAGWRLVGMDYRIVDPPLGVGKYRPKAGLPAAFFLARPDWAELSKTGRVVVVEGSKKAMVLQLPLGEQVVGIPGCLSWAGAVEALQGFEVTVVLDPDATKAAHKLGVAMGKGTTVLTLPTKPDDAFLQGNLDKAGFWELARRSGRKITRNREES